MEMLQAEPCDSQPPVVERKATIAANHRLKYSSAHFFSSPPRRQTSMNLTIAPRGSSTSKLVGQLLQQVSQRRLDLSYQFSRCNAVIVQRLANTTCQPKYNRCHFCLCQSHFILLSVICKSCNPPAINKPTTKQVKLPERTM